MERKWRIFIRRRNTVIEISPLERVGERDRDFERGEREREILTKRLDREREEILRERTGVERGGGMKRDFLFFSF